MKHALPAGPLDDAIISKALTISSVRKRAAKAEEIEKDIRA
jgi:hypothetical protein